MALVWILGGLVVYGLAVGGLFVAQDSMIFPRSIAEQPKYQVWQSAERQSLSTMNGDMIHGYLIRATKPSKGLLIGFSGNAWNAQDCATFIAKRVQDWDIVVFHYRGFSPSQGSPSETALFADALLIYDHFVAELTPQKVVGLGFSLGSGVVSYLGAERHLDGQVLFTPFDSIAQVAQKRYPIIPVELLIKHPFRSVLHQRRHATPAAVVLASHDRVVPRVHSERLIEAVEDVQFRETIADSTHGGIYDLAEVDDVLRRAIDAVTDVPTKSAAKHDQ